MRVDRAAVREPDAPRGPLDVEADHLPGGEHLRAELQRLHPGARGQLGAGHPVRETEIVLDPGALAGLAAGRGPLDQHGLQAFGGAVHGRTEPGRAAADHHQVVEVLGRGGAQADPGGQVRVARRDHGLPVRCDDQRQSPAVHPGRGQQPLPVRLVGGEPAVGHLVAGQELADLRAARRPAVPDHLGHVHGLVVLQPPRLQLGVDHRVELLFRRVPRLEQVVIEVHDVDGLDRGVSVRIGGEQHPAGGRVHVHRLFEELDAVHLRHPVVSQDHRHLVAAQPHLLQRVEGCRARFGAHDAVLLRVALAEVAGDGPGNPGIVVYGQDRGAGRAVRRGRRHARPHPGLMVCGLVLAGRVCPSRLGHCITPWYGNRQSSHHPCRARSLRAWAGAAGPGRSAGPGHPGRRGPGGKAGGQTTVPRTPPRPQP